MNKKLNLAALAILLVACNKDISNGRIGLYVKSDGLSPSQVSAYEDQVLKKDKSIRFGRELTIEILGVDDFKKDQNGHVFPGGENSLVDEDNKVLYFVPDYFKKYDLSGVSPEDAQKLKFNLRVGKPMEKGKTYHFLFRLWDKKSDKELKGNIELNVI